LHGLAQDDQQRDAIFRSKCPQVCHSYISSACIARKWRSHTDCISSPNSGLGLDSPQQDGCQAPADWNHVQYSVHFVEAKLAQPPSDLGSFVGNPIDSYKAC